MSNSTSSLRHWEALCRARGGRMTRQRRAVAEALLAAGCPVSAYELCDRLRPHDAALTPASVYRSLDFLMEHGLVHRLETQKRFIACEHPGRAHAVQFLICRRCGTLVEAEDEPVARAAERLGARLGFRVDHHTVELTGTCSGCVEGGEGAPP